MATATTSTPTVARRGSEATHGPEELLDLVADVARCALATGAVRVPKEVSMPLFNRTKVDVDRARGIADPKRDPERTPTADAIQMRFKELAGRKVPWSELLEVALRQPEQRTMWFAALGREAVRDDLTDELVEHALRRVAHELDGERPRTPLIQRRAPQARPARPKRCTATTVCSTASCRLPTRYLRTAA
jgi:hypothetical protein